MSVQQAKDFVTGLKTLSDQFKTDAGNRTDQYTEATEGIAQEFVDASHSYAKDMVTRADQYIKDIQSLYKSVYPEDAGSVPPPDGGEPVDPGYGIDEEAGYKPPTGGTKPPSSGGGDWEGKPSDPHPSTGPVGPQPKSKKSS